MSASALLFSSDVPQQPGFTFPQSLTEKYRPRTIDQFAGLEKPKNIMRKLVANPYESSWLFLGSSGIGKTSMAMAVAESMPAELHHIPSQYCNLENIERVCRTCQYVPMAGKRMHLVLVDEADCMSDAAKTAFLSKLDATAPVPNTIFIFTCNSIDRFSQAFMSRNRLIEFTSYGISGEATALLQRVWDAEAAGSPSPNLARIVKDSSNNVREALMRLETEIMAS